ncbi:MAG TPA: 50S ribosomal protein L28 [Limnochordia bacterium]
MARRCIICDKHTRSGKNVSHAENRTPRRFLPNLQRMRIVVDGRRQRAYVCTKCLKAGKVARAVS